MNMTGTKTFEWIRRKSRKQHPTFKKVIAYLFKFLRTEIKGISFRVGSLLNYVLEVPTHSLKD